MGLEVPRLTMSILFAILGLAVGVLVNQLGSDLPARRRLTSPHCLHCDAPRPWWQWLTLPAVLVGRGRCPSCGAPLRRRYPLVEAGLAVTYALLWLTVGPSVRLVLYLIYAAVFALVLVTDLERRLILNAVMYPAIALAAVAAFFTPGMTWWSGWLGGLIGFVLFFVAHLAGHALFGSCALGQGDITLATFVGLITGFPLVIEALLWTIISGAVISLLLIVTRRRTLRDYIPYGPFLVIGAVVTLMWGYPVAEQFLY